MHLAQLSAPGFEDAMVTPRGKRINVGTDDEIGSEIDSKLTIADVFCTDVDLLSLLRVVGTFLHHSEES